MYEISIQTSEPLLRKWQKKLYEIFCRILQSLTHRSVLSRNRNKLPHSLT